MPVFHQVLKGQAHHSPLYLSYQDFNQPFVLEIDASNTGLGAVLTQRQNEMNGDIAHASRALRHPERKAGYSRQWVELALKWAVCVKWIDYFSGSSFVVVTDNNPLTYVMPMSKVFALGKRWMNDLASFTFPFRYRPGKLNVDAPTLSRLPRGRH